MEDLLLFLRVMKSRLRDRAIVRNAHGHMLAHHRLVLRFLSSGRNATVIGEGGCDVMIGMLHCLLVLLLVRVLLHVVALQFGKIHSELQEIGKVIFVAGCHQRLVGELLWPGHGSVVLHCEGVMLAIGTLCGRRGLADGGFSAAAPISRRRKMCRRIIRMPKIPGGCLSRRWPAGVMCACVYILCLVSTAESRLGEELIVLVSEDVEL